MEQIQVTRSRVISRVEMAYDYDGVLKGGHVIWWDVLKDAEGNLISAREGEAEPIEGALQPGCAFAELLDQVNAQLLVSVAAKDKAISGLERSLEAALESKQEVT